MLLLYPISIPENLLRAQRGRAPSPESDFTDKEYAAAVGNVEESILVLLHYSYSIESPLLS